MFNINDRVRYKNNEMDKVYGVLIIVSINEQIATCSDLSYDNLGNTIHNILLCDLVMSD
jgi:hypothetical protein